MQLTDRQQILFDRLVTLGEWVMDGELPLTIFEITGFGSFFRGKPRPRDVDLIVRIQHSERLPEFDKFVEVLKSFRNDLDLEDQHQTPHAALVQMISARDKRIADIPENNLRKYLNWIESHSWNMLRPQTMHGQSALESPTDYAKRMIKKRLPNLNIFAFCNRDDTDSRPSWLRCGFTVCIWSHKRPNTKENLVNLLSEASMRDNLARELAYFEVQLPKLRAHVQLIETEIKLLLKIPRRRKTPNTPWKWFEEWSKNHNDLRNVRLEFERSASVALKFDEEEWNLPKSSLGEHRTVASASNAADESRKEIKRLYEAIDRLEAIREKLAQYKSGDATTPLSASDFVVDELLSKGSKTSIEKMLAFLCQLGFPVDHHERRQDI